MTRSTFSKDVDESDYRLLRSRPRIVGAPVPPATASGDLGRASTDEAHATEHEMLTRLLLPASTPKALSRTSHFIRLNAWEGAVTERFDTYFDAEVVDLDTSERAMVEFDLDEIAEDDIQLCEPGALFYWSIGYEVKAGGQRSKSSVIRFRRLGSV